MIRNLLIILIILFLTNFRVYALEITLTEGTIKPTPIAVTNFFSDDIQIQKIGNNISQVISNNLERSGLFQPINNKAFIQDISSLAIQPRFEDWKVIKAQHLIAGKIFKSNHKKIKLSIFCEYDLEPTIRNSLCEKYLFIVKLFNNNYFKQQ